MTNTVLTDEQIRDFHVWDMYDFARAIEQAVLQSPEIQALKKDAERYRWLRDSGNDDISVVSGLGCIDSGSSNVVGTYEYILDGEQLDSSIDLACRAEEEGNK